MRYVILTDIHGNHAALEAALADMEQYRPDAVLFLGDYITDGPFPERVIELLREFDRRYFCHFLRGNREEYMLEQRRTEENLWEPGSQSGSLWYTYRHLTDRDLDFFERMPVSMVIRHGDAPPVGICHATPTSSLGRPYKDEDRANGLQYLKTTGLSLLFCGHVHRDAEISYGKQKIVFCPSLGLSLHVKTPAPLRLTVADWENDAWKVAYRPVNYDVRAYVREVEASDFYSAAHIWAAAIVETLLTYQNCTAHCLAEARRLSMEDGFHGGSIPEIYWLRAAEMLKIPVTTPVEE